jgi:hypothetical protein
MIEEQKQESLKKPKKTLVSAKHKIKKNSAVPVLTKEFDKNRNLVEVKQKHISRLS